MEPARASPACRCDPGIKQNFSVYISQHTHVSFPRSSITYSISNTALNLGRPAIM